MVTEGNQSKLALSGISFITMKGMEISEACGIACVMEIVLVYKSPGKEVHVCVLYLGQDPGQTGSSCARSGC